VNVEALAPSAATTSSEDIDFLPFGLLCVLKKCNRRQSRPVITYETSARKALEQRKKQEQKEK
jgi:hypothetical protein